MQMSDVIADMLTRIRNANKNSHTAAPPQRSQARDSSRLGRDIRLESRDPGPKPRTLARAQNRI